MKRCYKIGNLLVLFGISMELIQDFSIELDQ